MGNDNKNGNDGDTKDFSPDKTSIIQSDTFKLRLAQAGQAPPSLVLLVGPVNSVGRQWPIEDTDRIVGRAPSSHIYVDERSLSKSHAKLVLSAGDTSIVDLESTNKTLINGKQIPPLQPQKLKNNDQIKMGNVIFKFLERGSIETVASAQTYDRSQTDALTGIANRGALNARAVELFKRSALLGIPFSLIVFDIDKFKSVNDTYGHPAGDYVIKEIATVVRDKLIRENDFFARIGGEEFILVLLGSTLQTAQEVAERVRHTIEANLFFFENQKLTITVSAGVSSNKDSDKNWEGIYDRADKALYQAKNSGRNKVIVF
ncbi:MAG: GGDEF domain-containing protein [Bdellovibrionales bacterium]|nr:GGDEF domain-containing protein [Bdellovibrionales bacterium]